MRRRTVRFFGLGIAGVGLAVAIACGARTGLEVAREVDASLDVRTGPFDAPVIFEEPSLDARAFDVTTECTTPRTCDPMNPGFVYKCGVKVAECGSLEQCVEPCAKGETGEACEATCKNPCVHTLGQNTSNGCEFYALEMDTTSEAVGTCYAVFVVNQWHSGQPAKLAVDFGGALYTPQQIDGFARIPSGTGTGIVYRPFDDAAGLPRNEIAILFLSRDPVAAANDKNSPLDATKIANCPPGVVPAVVGDAAIHGTGIGKAFHISSNVPIVAYQMLPYGGGHARITGATLLLPTNVWGTNYMAANAYSVPLASVGTLPDGGKILTDELQPGSGPTMAIVAEADDTRVTIKPVHPILPGGPLPGAPAHQPVTYTVNKGQYLQFTQPEELTGSPIESDKPIAVIGGSTLMDMPATILRADSAEQMLPPISALGSEYVAVRYRSRDPNSEESTVWRIVGVVDGTTLKYDPARPPGAPLTINQGQVREIHSPGPWVVSSQDPDHPFYFAQYMTGGQYLGSNDAGVLEIDASSLLYGQGDPEFVNVISPTQYLPSYTFFTDPTYPETNLVVISAIDPVTRQFPTVDLDCAGTLKGWQPAGTSGNYQFTRIDLSTGNFQGQNGCNNGVHTIRATLPGAPPGDVAAIGVTVWGWGSQATAPDGLGADEVDAETNPNFTCWVSYAYPAGVNIAKLNNVFVPAKN